MTRIRCRRLNQASQIDQIGDTLGIAFDIALEKETSADDPADLSVVESTQPVDTRDHRGVAWRSRCVHSMRLFHVGACRSVLDSPCDEDLRPASLFEVRIRAAGVSGRAERFLGDSADEVRPTHRRRLSDEPWDTFRVRIVRRVVAGEGPQEAIPPPGSHRACIASDRLARDREEGLDGLQLERIPSHRLLAELDRALRVPTRLGPWPDRL